MTTVDNFFNNCILILVITITIYLLEDDLRIKKMKVEKLKNYNKIEKFSNNQIKEIIEGFIDLDQQDKKNIKKEKKNIKKDKKIKKNKSNSDHKSLINELIDNFYISVDGTFEVNKNFYDDIDKDKTDNITSNEEIDEIFNYHSIEKKEKKIKLI